MLPLLRRCRLQVTLRRTFLLTLIIGSICPILIYIQESEYLHQSFRRPIRVFCLILTAPKYFATRARAVNLTWAPRCDRYVFISEYSDQSHGLPLASIINIQPGYQHLTQKVSLALIYVYEHFRDDFDWFLKSDDDTYVFVENLKRFLIRQNPSLPITFGYNYKVGVKGGYHSGGAAYVLSHDALRRYFQAYHEPNSSCTKDGPNEDVQIAACLRRSGVTLGQSLDEKKRERFHPLSYPTHFFGPIPKWLNTYSQHHPSTGKNCCSDGTISFHYVSPEQQFFMDHMHYGIQR